MATKNKNKIDEEPEFIRLVRENAKAKYCYVSPPKEDSSNRSVDKVVSNSDTSSEVNQEDVMGANDNLGDFDNDKVHVKVVGENEPYEAATVTTPTDVTSATEATLSNHSNITEAIEATEMSEVTETADVARVAEVSVVEDNSANKLSQKDEVPQPRVSTSNYEPTTPTPKVSRISAKMRKASRIEFCDAYTGKVDTKGGKPISIAAPVIDRLYRLCSLTGDRNACPTYVINNLLSEFLDTVEPEARKWRQLD